MIYSKLSLDDAYECFLVTCMALQMPPIPFEDWKALYDELKGVSS